MCGIAGFVGCPDRESAGLSLRAMVDALQRRGPDSEGISRWPGALLGHRRLAIIDLSPAGHQPMLSEDGRVGLVFNGCIYNFQELRRELEQRGHRFRSQCDTEVLLRGYQEWGARGLAPRLRGMFAFAIWDDPRQTLTLVRDRLGVKPLAYCAQNGAFSFASTVAALRAGGFGEELDAKAVLEYLEFGYVTEERTIFREVAKVPPATILQWRDGAVRMEPYWSLPDAVEDSRITFDEAVEETERLLLEAVRLRLYSDVPIGALLSGGIDSALVCWAMAKLNANLTAFTVSTPGDPADEAEMTRETAKILGIPHQVVSIPKEQQSVLGELTAAYGEPFACSSALAMLRVSRAVKPHATVLLTGDGGDDVFLGYPFHLHYLRAQQLARSLPSFAPSAWRALRPLANAFPALRRPKHFLDYATGGLGAITRVADGLPYYQSRQILGGRLDAVELDQRRIPLSFDSARNLLSDLLRYQQKMWFLCEFMPKVDGGTMHHGLEARSPFLDHALWEFAARLPLALRLHGGVLKAILRALVRKRISPRVAARRKRGFTIPVERWLTGPWRGAIDHAARGSRLEREGWLRAGAFERIAAEAPSGETPRQLWFLVVLENWMRANAGVTRPSGTPIPG